MSADPNVGCGRHDEGDEVLFVDEGFKLVKLRLIVIHDGSGMYDSNNGMCRRVKDKSTAGRLLWMWCN